MGKKAKKAAEELTYFASYILGYEYDEPVQIAEGYHVVIRSKPHRLLWGPSVNLPPVADVIVAEHRIIGWPTIEDGTLRDFAQKLSEKLGEPAEWTWVPLRHAGLWQQGVVINTRHPKLLWRWRITQSGVSFQPANVKTAKYTLPPELVDRILRRHDRLMSDEEWKAAGVEEERAMRRYARGIREEERRGR